MIFTVSAKRRRRRSAALPLTLNGTEKETLPAGSEARTSRPTRSGGECLALAGEAEAVNRPTSRRPPEPLWDTSIDP